MSDLSNQHEIAAYIKANPVMVLGTVDEHNSPHGAAVYVCLVAADHLYFVTKTETQKFKNITHNPKVSVTIVNPSENSSLQAVGGVHIEKDAQIIEMVMEKMTKIYAHSADWLPPIAKLRAGAYQIVGIKLHHARLAQFKGKHAGSQHIFKEW
jgi:general stress protein 26